VPAEPAGLWLPDLLVAVSLAVFALLVWRGQRAAAIIAIVFAVTWVAGSLTPIALYWHRGPLIHLLARPARHRFPRTFAVVIGVGYFTAIVPPVGSDDVIASVIAVGLMSLMLAAGSSTVDVVAAVIYGLVMVGGSVARFLVPGYAAVVPSLLGYDAGMIALAVLWLARGLGSERVRVSDLVLELGGVPTEPLRDELARAIGDPGLKVGVWDGDSASYRATTDEVLDADHPGPGSRATRIDHEGEPYLLLVHRPDAFDDPRLLAGVEAAVRLAERNTRLQDQARERLAEVTASRLRILVAEDTERRRLGQRVSRMVTGDLDALAEDVAALRRTAGPVARDGLELAATRLGEVRGSIEDAIVGLAPRALDGGLMAALRVLAERSPIRVEVAGRPPRLPGPVETALAFACAEAVTNAVKHAGATRVRIQVSTDASGVVVEISDDGRGGAVASRGSGLTGIIDRMEALGGSAVVKSPAGVGTVITLTLPADVAERAEPD
jgi:signal transduction histidine kinase